MDECGGCQGLGSHRRWCPESVGPPASFYGKLSERAESLGDTVGANETGAANHLYAAAALLRTKAKVLAQEWATRDDAAELRSPDSSPSSDNAR